MNTTLKAGVMAEAMTDPARVVGKMTARTPAATISQTEAQQAAAKELDRAQAVAGRKGNSRS